MITRRSILTGAGALLVAAPSIVRAQSIMPVRPLVCHLEGGYYPGRYAHFYDGWADGTSFTETVDFHTHTSEIQWTLGRHSEILSGGNVSLSRAEMWRRSVEGWAERRTFTEPSHV